VRGFRNRGGSIFLVIVVSAFSPIAAGAGEPAADEIATHRSIGKALYENDKFPEAAAEFRRCLELASGSTVDRFNLALVLVRAGKSDEALAEIGKVLAADPGFTGALYIQGIVLKRLEKYPEAIVALNGVLAKDPGCRPAHYNIGVCLKYLEKYKEAIEAFLAAAKISPDDPTSHYQLVTLYRRVGDVEGAARHAEVYERVKGTLDDSEKTVEALERSKYSSILCPPSASAQGAARPPGSARFRDATEGSGLKGGPPAAGAGDRGPVRVASKEFGDPAVRARLVSRIGGGLALGDPDGDGDLDVFIAGCPPSPAVSGDRLYRGDGKGGFEDITAGAGLGAPGLGMDAVFGDFDNDGWPDLYVARCGPNALCRNKGGGVFEDVSAATRTDDPGFARKAVFLDYDHDNDLDIFIANFASLDPPPGEGFLFPDDLAGEAPTLLRNGGSGSFADRTDEAGILLDLARTRDVVFADLDGDSDLDLFRAAADAPSRLLLNARLGRFVPGGSFDPPIPKGGTAAAEGDFDRNGVPDLVVSAGGRLLLQANDGRAGFAGTEIPLPGEAGGAADRIAVLDANDDGWGDLLLSGIEGGRLFLLSGDGPGKFRDDTGAAGLDASFGETAAIAPGDLDGDGDEDVLLLTRDRGPVLLRNENPGGSWISVRLAGKKSNRSACGAVVEISAAGEYQRKTCFGTRVRFGLGDRKAVDIVRVTWPNGIAQNEIRPPSGKVLTIEEYVRISASCAMLYAWDGSRFELVNEILGVAPLGAPMSPDACYPVDPKELTKIDAGRLVPKDGVFDLRLAEELREVTYADRIALRAVDHPAGLEVVPDEKFAPPPFSEDRFFAVSGRPPASATDDRGADVLPLLIEKDGRFPAFALTEHDGVAEPHSLILDLGDLPEGGPVILFLDGWIYWPDASATMALSQDPMHELRPLTLEVRDPAGGWRTAIPWVGLPTGKGSVVPVDLTGRLLSRDHRVRLSTNLRVSIDRAFVATRDEAARCRVTELPVASADLRRRGFSRMTREPSGYERYDYGDVSPAGPWSPPRGMLTRHGDVTPLLDRADDRCAIFGPGDELALRFEAGALPALPAGWVRDFIFVAEGWVKDGDLNTWTSETIEPLPFRAMSAYPYPPSERYPDDPEHRRYLLEYNTRPALPTVGPLSGGE
jgi:hypothetical protein